MTDGVMPLDGAWEIRRQHWPRKTVYALVKSNFSVAAFDNMQQALAVYRHIKRADIEPDADEIRRLKSYRDEWES